MTLLKFKRQKESPPTDSSQLVPLAAGPKARTFGFKLIWTSMGFLGIFIGSWILVNQHIAATKPITPYAISFSTGKKVPISKIEGLLDRQEAVKTFVNDTFTGLYTWKDILPPLTPQQFASPQKDEGVQVKGGKIPTFSYIYSFAFSPHRAKAAQEMVAQHIEKHKVGASNNIKETVFVTEKITEPIEYKSGFLNSSPERWTCSIYGNQILRSTDKTTVLDLAYEVEITKAEIVPLSRLMESFKDPAKPEESKSLAEIVADIRSSALQITKITPIPTNAQPRTYSNQPRK